MTLHYFPINYFFERVLYNIISIGKKQYSTIKIYTIRRSLTNETDMPINSDKNVLES